MLEEEDHVLQEDPLDPARWGLMNGMNPGIDDHLCMVDGERPPEADTVLTYNEPTPGESAPRAAHGLACRSDVPLSTSLPTFRIACRLLLPPGCQHVWH